MDAVLLVAGILVVAFDAYAYSIYSQGRESLETVYSSTERALRVKRHFDADQEPMEQFNGQKPARKGDSAVIAGKSTSSQVEAVEINVPLKQDRAGAPEFVQNSANGTDLVLLRGEVESLRQKLAAVERVYIQATSGRTRLSLAEIDSKQAELHRLFMRRQISDDTYRTMCAEIAKIRLGI